MAQEKVKGQNFGDAVGHQAQMSLGWNMGLWEGREGEKIGHTE